MSDLWQPLTLSLQIAAVATVLTMLLGTPLAYVMARRHFPGRNVFEAFILLPLVLPPTVVGYLILMAMGRGGWLTRYFPEAWDYSITFRLEGAIVAALVVALPMLYIPAKAAFAAVDRDLEDSAKIMGATRLQLFWHISVPLARRGLISGIILAFARAIGEFGATMMVFGWRENQLTLPISIYADWVNGPLSHAQAAVMALSVMSLALVLAYNLVVGKRE
jgi:molybdate transport system permease protein